MKNPYDDRPDSAFWSRAVARVPAAAVDPVTPGGRFAIGPADPVATAGSCFAQHIARFLVGSGFNFLRTEADPAGEGAAAAAGGDPHGYGLFSARYGNVYTCRQMLQLFRRAYGLFEPADDVWTRAEDGRLVDAFRPRIAARGFDTAEALRREREGHLACVRRAFEDCAVFVFTLGLTEAWRSRADGAVYPLAPGVVAAGPDPAAYEFHNFTVAEVAADLDEFLLGLREVNPGVRCILTVSPVPLVATYTEAHVLAATTYSKAVLRVAAQQAADRHGARVAYFPSYEMITGPQARGRFFADDLRSVTAEGVASVMSVFRRHFLEPGGDGGGRDIPGATPRPAAARAAEPPPPPPRPAPPLSASAEYAELLDVVCDEEELDRRG